MLQPNPSAKENNDQFLARSRDIAQHQTAVVILENYTEEEIGDQFRDRGTPWLVGLRQSRISAHRFPSRPGVANPEGLITLAQYD